jgi:hypothetical protein
VSKGITNLIEGGRNVIVYGKMSEKSTLIKKMLKYGKNEIHSNNDTLKNKNI